MIRTSLAVLLLLAGGCAKNTAQTAVVTAPPPLELHGAVPADPLPVPEFTAHSHDGTVRGPGDLRGAMTVLWFFPAAYTAG